MDLIQNVNRNRTCLSEILLEAFLLGDHRRGWWFGPPSRPGHRRAPFLVLSAVTGNVRPLFGLHGSGDPGTAILAHTARWSEKPILSTPQAIGNGPRRKIQSSFRPRYLKLLRSIPEAYENRAPRALV